MKELYDSLFEQSASKDSVLGPLAKYIWENDPKHLLFTLARYKFCAKMLQGKEKVLEIGCGDGLGAPVLLQSVKFLYGVDIESRLIEENARRLNKFSGRLSYIVADFTHLELLNVKQKYFDAAISLDVLEHIEKEKEKIFFENISLSMTDDGVCIIGMPNITSNEYATELNKKAHINLKEHFELRELMLSYFKTVFLFSMNDEIVHTGFYPMAHYLFAIGVGKRNR